MPILFGFQQLAALPEERITDKISRRVLSGKQSMMVWWKIKAGAHAAALITDAEVHLSIEQPYDLLVRMLVGRRMRAGLDLPPHHHALFARQYPAADLLGDALFRQRRELLKTEQDGHATSVYSGLARHRELDGEQHR